MVTIVFICSYDNSLEPVVVWVLEVYVLCDRSAPFRNEAQFIHPKVADV